MIREEQRSRPRRAETKSEPLDGEGVAAAAVRTFARGAATSANATTPRLFVDTALRSARPFIVARGSDIREAPGLSKPLNKT